MITTAKLILLAFVLLLITLLATAVFAQQQINTQTTTALLPTTFSTNDTVVIMAQLVLITNSVGQPIIPNQSLADRRSLTFVFTSPVSMIISGQ